MTIKNQNNEVRSQFFTPTDAQDQYAISITDMIHKHIDKNLPYPFGWLTEYLYVIAGLLHSKTTEQKNIKSAFNFMIKTLS